MATDLRTFVEARIERIPFHTCWEWTGAHNSITRRVCLKCGLVGGDIESHGNEDMDAHQRNCAGKGAFQEPDWGNLSTWAMQGGVCELGDLKSWFKERFNNPTRIVNRITGELVAVVAQGPEHDAVIRAIQVPTPNHTADTQTGKAE